MDSLCYGTRWLGQNLSGKFCWINILVAILWMRVLWLLLLHLLLIHTQYTLIISQVLWFVLSLSTLMVLRDPLIWVRIAGIVFVLYIMEFLPIIIICNALASLSRHLCTDYVDLAGLTACCIRPLQINFLFPVHRPHLFHLSTKNSIISVFFHYFRVFLYIQVFNYYN